MSKETGPKAAASSITEAVKGVAKEMAGAATRDDSLRKEGREQQKKADAERDVAANEAAAEKSRAEAAAHESAERAHQR